MYFKKKDFGGYYTSVHYVIASHARGHWFKSSTAHQWNKEENKWNQMVIIGADWLPLAES